MEYAFEERDWTLTTTNDNDDYKNHADIDLDITKMKNLTRPQLSIQHLIWDKFDSIFFKIIYPPSGENEFDVGGGDAEPFFDYYFMIDNPEFDPRYNYFTLKEYRIFSADPAYVEMMKKNKKIKTYTINVKENSRLDSIRFHHRDDVLADDLVLKPQINFITQKIMHHLLLKSK